MMRPERRLLMAPFQPEHVGWLVTQFPTPQDLFQWSGNRFSFPLTKEQLEKHLFYANNQALPRSWLHCALDDENRNIVGYGEIANLNQKNNSAFLARILIGKKFRGCGLGFELVRTLLEKSFGKHNLHRLELNVFAFNEVARRCYHRAGFITEGKLRESCFDGKIFHDEYRLSILKKEWRANLNNLNPNL